jgi:hypothetical protein
MTMTRSSTISQPTAIRPFSDCTRSRSCSARKSTTVDATESARPKIRLPPRLHPSIQPIAVPKAVATAICPSAPGTAITLHRHQVARREVQAHPEHQKDHPKLGQFRGKPQSAT